MRTTIDKAGRLVIPRVLRDRMGLAEGGEVEIELDGAAVRIEAVSGDEVKRATQSGASYAAAWDEWSGEDGELWASTSGDGIGPR